MIWNVGQGEYILCTERCMLEGSVVKLSLELKPSSCVFDYSNLPYFFWSRVANALHLSDLINGVASEVPTVLLTPKLSHMWKIYQSICVHQNWYGDATYLKFQILVIVSI